MYTIRVLDLPNVGTDAGEPQCAATKATAMANDTGYVVTVEDTATGRMCEITADMDPAKAATAIANLGEEAGE